MAPSGSMQQCPLKYKARRWRGIEAGREEFIGLLSRLEELRFADPALDVTASARWPSFHAGIARRLQGWSWTAGKRNLMPTFAPASPSTIGPTAARGAGSLRMPSRAMALRGVLGPSVRYSQLFTDEERAEAGTGGSMRQGARS